MSGLLVAVWLGSAALVSPWSAPKSSVASVVAPETLPGIARMALIYILAFTFYGLVTVWIGATARDSSTAQTLSRPMFAVLLAAFFVILTATSGRPVGLDWLIYVPPFTPSILLMAGAGQISAVSQLSSVILMLAAIALAGRLATSRVTLSRH